MKNGELNQENRINKIYRTFESNSGIYSNSKSGINFDVFEKIRKSICKIKSVDKSEESFGTGFFIYYNSYQYLMTNSHVISKKSREKKKIEIEIWDETKIPLSLKNRYIIDLSGKKDIFIIGLNIDDINKIEYLYFDLDNSKEYNHYLKNDVLGVGYPKGELSSDRGKITGIIKEYEFYHNIQTDFGSSGTPIISLNSFKVVGIHKNSNNNNKFHLKIGTFIYEAIKEIDKKKYYPIINKNTINCSYLNEINCIYFVKENDEINLLYDFKENINNYNVEESKRAHNETKKFINGENIDIYIKDRKIKFSQKYKSNETGSIYVKFKFKKILTSTAFMFYKCSALKSIDLSLFNAQDVTSMFSMFEGCTSLESIDLSSLNTKNVNEMTLMFNNCSSLKSIDLSSFNSNSLTDVRGMFQYCKSLESIDLSSFNTKKVTDMRCMFQFCNSLRSIDLSSFNTDNVTNMSFMFRKCFSLETLDLSTFNTSSVTDLSFMFTACFSLNSINLSSFKTNNVTNMKCMFSYCKSLKSLNLSSFDTSNVTDMYGMFFNCDWLKSLDLSSFDTTSVINMRFMFNLCSSLEKQNIKVSEKGTNILDEFETSIIVNFFKSIFK